MGMPVSNQLGSCIFTWPILFAIFVGGLAILRCIPAISASNKAQNWCQVSGKITRAGIRTAFSTLNKSPHTVYILDVGYEYDVDGNHYYGSQIEFGFPKRNMRQQAAQREADRYHAGDAVTIFYDPTAPENSTLSIDISSTTEREIMIGVMILIVSIVLLFGALNHLHNVGLLGT